jgi:hypothetical protein
MIASNMIFPLTVRKEVKIPPLLFSALKALMSEVIRPCRNVCESGPLIEMTFFESSLVTQPFVPSFSFCAPSPPTKRDQRKDMVYSKHEVLGSL